MDTPKNILLIDDDEDDRIIFMEAIRDSHITANCYYARNGEEALKMLGEDTLQPPDFIFLDLNMPRLNGKQCLAEMKKISAIQHVPVIVYTTSKLDQDVIETRALGASYFLTKPNLFGDLQKAVLHIISGKKLPVGENITELVELI